MPASVPPGRCARIIVLLATVLLVARCDLPTEPPRFAFTTGVNVPLLVDQTFVFIGPSDTGLDALIDTTSNRFDSVFTVDAVHQTVAITQEFDGFESELSDDLVPTLEVAPIDIVFSADEIAGTGSGGAGGSAPFTPMGEFFGSGSSLSLDVADVRFSGTEDYVELDRGTLRVDGLVNEFDVTFDELLVSIPSLRRAPYGAGDSLVVRFRGLVDLPDEARFHRVDRRSGPRNASVDLSGYRLFAPENQIRYNVLGRNETATDVRIIEASEQLRLAVRIEDVVVSAVSAELDPVEVSVTRDANGDGSVDVLDDAEANVASFDGLDLFDDIELSNVQLVGTELRMHVRTNIAADVALYAALVGIDADGEAIYLEGKGTAAVASSDPVATAFAAGGATIDPQRLIRIELQGAPSPDTPVVRTVVLNETNSNVDAFISRVPTELRMAARMIVQPDGGRVHLRQPFLFETSFGTTIPLGIASGITLDKTFDADLSDLEDVADDTSDAVIEEAELELTYANGLPLGLDLQVDVLDAADAVVASFPKEGQSLHIDPATTTDIGLSDQSSPGTFTVGVTRDDLVAMSRGERIRLRFGLTTTEHGQARLRATDTFTLRLSGRFRVRLRAE